MTCYCVSSQRFNLSENVAETHKIVQLTQHSIMVTSYRQTFDTITVLANTRRWPNVVLMLGQRRRWWANILPALDQRLV